jgi:ATP-dependent Clp protease ATP-binding subunit ClpA/ATP-dependent Clp protease ATP-binding subunit ClpC
MLTKFNEQAQKAIVIAESIAFDLGHNNVGSEHLLLSLLKMSDSKLKTLFEEYNVDDKKIYNDIIRLFGENDSQPFYMEYSDVVKDILESAIKITKERGKSKVTLSILSIALLQINESVALELLKKYNVDIEDIIFKLKENSELESKLDQVQSMVNLNKKVKKDDYQIVGREKEIEQICTILCKKEKNNVLIIGEAGVGKSALVEKLARRINDKQVPEALEKTLVYELSLAGIVAGTKYRGEFEEKLKKVIDKVREVENVVIFIDEIHNIIGAGGAEGAIDASNILKPYLARKDITIIGATTLEEYYKHFEKDQAMNRRFSLVTLKENSKEETLEILNNVKQYYETFHAIEISEQALQYLVDKVDMYIRNRTFPDKAIDILDLACVKTKFNQKHIITKETIKTVIEEYTLIKIDEEIIYDDVAKKLKDVIIGQNHAIDTVVNQLKVSKSISRKPQAVFLFMGSSGIGKTKTAKELSRILNRHLIRLDMSEYKSSASVQKIIGSPPGYIGYDSPSLLLPKLSTHPKSILLLDEVEKAHQDVLNLFLQVFDEGYLEDNQKRKIYFDNTIIIMTSNIGSSYSMLGFKKSTTSTTKLTSMFSDEFVNRIDEAIPFKNLTTKSLKRIISESSEVTLTEEELEEIIADYDTKTGARGAIRKMNKYILNKTSI